MQDRKNILIIGHRGRMGVFFKRRFSSLNFNVSGIDAPLKDIDLSKACAKIDLALFCVPMAVMSEVLGQICPHLPSDCVLADITSVKVQAMECMQKHWQGPIVGTHPLFGAKPPKGSDLPVVIVPIVEEEALGNAYMATTDEHIAFVENLFIGMGCRCFRSTAHKHDMAMSAIQNLNFITSLAYFATLSHDEDLLPFLTPSFRRRQDAAQKMLTEDAELFKGLFNANPHSHEYVRKYRAFLNIAAGGDIDLLNERAAWWWK